VPTAILKKSGSIKVGKDANFVILEKALMAVVAAELRALKVKQTWVASRKVFER